MSLFSSYHLQWAKIIIVLERTFSRKSLLKYQEEYAVSVMVPGSDKEEPGLMVIKTSMKTKARQRKGDISNWKVRAGLFCVIRVWTLF